jgi:hypothetical protein
MASKSKKPAKTKSAKPATKITSLEQPNNEGERQLMISEVAYYRAEYRGFEPGHEIEDWLEAEKQIKEMLYAA